MLIKRVLDIIMSGGLLILIAPVILVVAIFVRLDSKGPVFYSQTRVGRFGKLFKIFKFRTMIEEADSKGPLISLSSDTRVTRLGLFLRKFKIDEIPQLINVLLGDMSMVGPRPEVPKYVKFYRALEKELILSVRPGITDLASLCFRDESKMLNCNEDFEAKYVNDIIPEKVKHYILYVEKQSLMFDFKILVLTFVILVLRCDYLTVMKLLDSKYKSNVFK